MDDGVFTILLGLAAFSNRAAELAKPLVHAWFKDERIRTFMLKFISVVAGMFAALLLNVNFFARIPESMMLVRMTPLAGVIFTGCLASIGSEFLYLIYDLMYGARNKIQPPNTTTSESTLTVRKTETKPDEPAANGAG